MQQNLIHISALDNQFLKLLENQQADEKIKKSLNFEFQPIQEVVKKVSFAFSKK